MSGYTLTDSQIEATLNAISDCRDQDGRINQSKLAERLKLSRSTVQNRLQRLGEKGLLGFDPVVPGFFIAKVSNEVDADGEVRKSWVTQKPDREPFEMPAGHVAKGVSALVDDDGRVIQKWIKTKAEDQTFGLIDALKETLSEYKAHEIEAPIQDMEDLLTVYVLPDLHVGMMSWKEETGENYDVNIAANLIRNLMSHLVAQSSPSRHAIVLGLGDYFHQNDQKNMTPRSGHILDVDGRWPRVLKAGCRLAVDAVQMAAQKHKRVTARFLPANHDPDAAHALTLALSMFFDRNERITVDDNPSHHFYHRHGRVLIGATHGHTMTPDRMAMMLACDRSDDWAAAPFRHMLFGHIHKETAKEVGNVRVESFQSPAAKDAHSASSGWRSGKSLSAITYSAERGEIGRHRVNILP